MNQLNKTDQTPPNDSKNKKNTPPSEKLLNLFNKTFDRAKETAETPDKKENSVEKNQPMKPSNKDTTEKKSYHFDQSDNLLQHFFPELGISNVQQIEKLMISVTQKIEQHQQSPSLETYQILLDKMNHPLRIEIQRKNNQVAIKLSCNNELHKLLSQYLPELKKHLRKKSINFDDIMLELDGSLTTENNQLESKGKK